MNSKEKNNVSYLVPFVLAMALVPLICIIHSYDCGLQDEEWIYINGNVSDFFLYYKSRLLIILGVIISCYMAWNLYTKKVKLTLDKQMWFVLGSVAAFLLFSLLSVLVSENPSFAFWGGYEQWEGFVVLFCYAALFFFGFAFVTSESRFRFVFGGIVIGALIIGVLGAFQAFGYDYINTDGMRAVLTSLEAAVKNAEIALAFEKGMTYSTLYNPNYVGTYAALLIPVLVGAAIWGKKIWVKTVAVLGVVCLLISVYAAGSFTGIIGIGASVLLLLVFLIPAWKRHVLAGSVAAGCLVLGVVLVLIVRPGPVSNVIAHLTETTQQSTNHVIEEMDLKDNTLCLTSNSGKKVKMDIGYDVAFQCSFPDEAYAPHFSQNLNDANNSMIVDLSENERVYVSSPDPSTLGTDLPVFKVSEEGKEYTFVWHDNKLKFCNEYGKPASLHDTEHLGFENNMQFATGRGYIWSRTFPLLKEHLFVGCGPDNFIYEYPNDDYVGKQNYGFAGQVITKPHNMYLQIWVQDGLIALLGFLAVVLIYIIDVFRLYFLGERKGFMAGMGLCVFFGIVGYMVVGLANDSTVTVAPVFWGLLGLGFALNRNCRLKNNG